MTPLQVYNQQWPEPQVAYREDGMLDVVDIFATIQGEGPFAGTPAVFVRLSGCNLRCRTCDTDYTSNRKFMKVEEILKAIDAVRGKSGLIVITGGEPFRQPIAELVLALLEYEVVPLSIEGFPEPQIQRLTVQIETNGTLFAEGLQSEIWERIYWNSFQIIRLSVICSPKSTTIEPKLLRFIMAFKYVLKAGEVGEDGLPTSILGRKFSPYRQPSHPDTWKRPIYIQPEDNQDPEINAANLKAVVDSALTHGHIMGIQLHKMIGVM